MAIPNDSPTTSPITRTNQIIMGTLTMSLIFFLTIILYLNWQKSHKLVDPSRPPSVLTYAAFVFGGVGILASLIVPKMVVARARREIASGTWAPPRQGDREDLVVPAPAPGPSGDPVRLAEVYQTQKIIGGALNEGPGFFALIAFFIEGSPWALGLALLLILGVALRIPTQAKVDEWVDDQLQRVAEERFAGA